MEDETINNLAKEMSNLAKILSDLINLVREARRRLPDLIAEIGPQISREMQLGRAHPEPSDPETLGAVDEIMRTLEPDIMDTSADILRNEVRDALLLGGNVKRIKEKMGQNKPMRLKRKKGCVFLELGSGAPDDPIEEISILRA